MKTAEAFYKEIANSKELQEELQAVSAETLGAFLSKHECNATADEFAAYIKAQAEGEIDDADVADVAGGVISIPSILQDIALNPKRPL